MRSRHRRFLSISSSLQGHTAQEPEPYRYHREVPLGAALFQQASAGGNATHMQRVASSCAADTARHMHRRARYRQRGQQWSSSQQPSCTVNVVSSVEPWSISGVCPALHGIPQHLCIFAISLFPELHHRGALCRKETTDPIYRYHYFQKGQARRDAPPRTAFLTVASRYTLSLFLPE